MYLASMRHPLRAHPPASHIAGIALVMAGFHEAFHDQFFQQLRMEVPTQASRRVGQPY